MKKIVSFITGGVCRSVAPVLFLFGAGGTAQGQSHMVDTTVSIEATASMGAIPGQFKVTFYKEDGSTELRDLTGTYTTVEATIDVAMKSGVEYDLKLWKSLYASASKVRLVAPLGWKFYIAEGTSSDLIERESFLLTVSQVDTWLRIKLLPHGAALASLPPGEASSLSHEGVIWSVGMGSLLNGRSAGAIQLRASSIAELSFTTADLYFSASGPEVDYYAPGGVLTQIFAPEALANVEGAGTDAYKISFYDWTQVLAKSGNTYPVTGAPFAVYEISKPAANQIRIKKQTGTKTWYTRLTYTTNWWMLYDWTQDGNEMLDCLRRVGTAIENVGNVQYAYTQEEGRPSGGSFAFSSSTRVTRENLGWGYEFKQLVKGYGTSAAQTTNLEYYVSAGDGKGHYKKLKRIDQPDGGQTRMTYFDDFDKRGLVKERYTPFEDTNDGRKTTYTYVLDVTGNSYLPDVVEEYILNGSYQQTGKTDFDYAAETWNSQPVRRTVRKDYFGSGGSDYLETTTRTYREDASHAFRRNMPLSIRRPDGTQTSFAMGQFSGPVYVFEAMEGTSAVPSGESYVFVQNYFDGAEDVDDIYIIDKKSTKRQNNRNAGGRPYATYESVGVVSGWFELMSEDGYAYDASAGGRLELRQRRAYANGSPAGSNTIYEADHDGMVPSWTKDEEGGKRIFAYDKQGRVNLVTHEGVSAHGAFPAIDTVYEFKGYDGSNRATSSSTSNVAQTESISSAWTYDLAGRMLTKTQDCCQTITYEYPASNQVKQKNPDYVLSPESGYVLTTYYRDGSVKSVSGDASVPTYNRGRILSGLLEHWNAQQDFNFGEYKDGWSIQRTDWLGRVKQIQEPTFDGGSRYVNLEYNSKGQLQVRRLQEYGSSGDLVAPFRYEYDALGRVLKQGLDVGAGGTLVDDSSDRMTKTVRSFYKDASNYWWGQLESYAFPPNSTGVLVERVRQRVAPPVGRLAESTTEDAFGNKVIETVDVDRTKAFVTVKSDAAPSPTNDAFSYIKAGLLVQTVDTAGVVTDFGYDQLRRRHMVLGRDNVTTIYTFIPGSSRVDLVKQDDGSSQIAVFDYDYNAAGQVSHQVAKNYRVGVAQDEHTYFLYNKLGQVAKRYGTGTFPIEYQHDSTGRLVLQHEYRDDAGTNKTSVAWKYQGSTGLLLAKKHITNLSGYLSNPDNTACFNATNYQYNKLGRPSRRTWQRGVYSDYTYFMGSVSDTGELKKEAHSDATTDVDYTYDRLGRLKTVSDATGLRTFNYTANSGLRLDTVDLPSFYGSNDLDYNYEDPNVNGDDYIHGRYKDVRYGSGVWMEKYNQQTGRFAHHIAYGSGYLRFFDYTYDSDSHHLQAVTELMDGNYIQERHYETWREARSATYTKWATATRTKFDTTTLTRQQQFEKVTLTRSDATSLAAQYGSGSNIVYDYRYDDRQQMTSFDASHTGGLDGSYGYDTAGNRVSSTDLFGTRSYSVNVLDQIEPTDAGTQFEWDSDGNLDEDEVWDHGYDANNRLASLRKKDNTQFLRFTYDYLGRRVEKQVFPNGTGTGTPSKHLKFIHNGMEMLAELDSAGGLRKSFHWGIDRSDTRTGAGGVEGLLLVHDWTTNQDYFPSYDMNGNVVGLFDGSGNWAAWYAYDPYGNVLSEGGSYKDENPIRFSTKYTDEETSLVDFGWRVYDPRKGRFINRDPIEEAGGANLYRFVGNDPANRWDLWGLCFPGAVCDDRGDSAPAGGGFWGIVGPGSLANEYDYGDPAGLPWQVVPWEIFPEDDEASSSSGGAGANVELFVPIGVMAAANSAVIDRASRIPEGWVYRGGPMGDPDWTLEDYQALFRELGWNNYDFYSPEIQIHYGKTAVDALRLGRTDALIAIVSEAQGFVMTDEDRIAYAMAAGMVFDTRSGRTFSEYKDTTFKGSRFPNRTTNVTRSEFERNLTTSGWTRSVSKDGKTVIYERNGAKYVVRDNALSTGGPTADYYSAGSNGISLKIRLQPDSTP